MSTEEFLRPRLIGQRFAGHAIPLELLRDLAVLQEMIVDVAKTEFLKDNPSRQRSPRGFTEGIELKLTGIEDGSAIPVISLVVAASAALFPPANQVYFERARDAVVSTIEAAEKNESVTEHLPEKALSYFDKMGRSLREDEAIEFSTPSHQASARLTRNTRRRILLASTKVRELTEEISVRGTIPEADQDRMTFEFQLIGGPKVQAPIASQHVDTIVEAFAGYKNGTRVLLQGVGRYNRNDRLLGFESVGRISILEALDIQARLDELRLLKDGWLEGRGVAPSVDGLQWLAVAFDRHYPEDLALPFLYPTEAGDIRAEWSLGTHESSLEIGLAKHAGEWHTLNMDSDYEETRSLNLNQASDWAWLAKQIQKRSGGEA